MGPETGQVPLPRPWQQPRPYMPRHGIVTREQLEAAWGFLLVLEVEEWLRGVS